MTMTLEQLDKHLFKCADIIRDTVDPTDYKEYILPLIFFKIINDTYEDEYQEALKEYQDEDIARDESLHMFNIPTKYNWKALLDRKKNISQFINEIFNKIEEKNREKLSGVFRADFVKAEALNDQKLGKLIQHLDKKNLSRDRLPADVLGEAYMDLVSYFASQEGKSGGQFFTPPIIVNLMVQLLAPFKKGETLHDPTAGSGGMLVEAAQYYKEVQKKDPSKLKLTGQEINPDIAAIAKMNIYIN
ncbi:MAG: class I SAM-dependent DNA methyltransferase, partial [Elusimicrobia bacterium]|nr:class I SAM-dependent DNA methyltransferase [Elusimicrobiota bacterium]